MSEVQVSDPSHPAADQEAPDGAAAAFDAMREELAFLRAAMRGFAARQNELAGRDYTEDLARLIDLQRRLVEATNALGRRPGLALTPETMAAEIDKAAVAARRADHEVLAEAARSHTEAAGQLEAMIGQARSKEKQFDALIWAYAVGVITMLVVILLRHLRGVPGL